MSDDMRQKLRELEREEKAITAINGAMRDIRLRGHVEVDGEKPKTKWWMVFKTGMRDTSPTILSPSVSGEVYEALGIVRSKHYDKANALAAELGTEVKVYG